MPHLLAGVVGRGSSRSSAAKARQVKRAEQLQPPVEQRVVELRWREHVDERRLRRVAEILLDILDNKVTPEEGRRP